MSHEKSLPVEDAESRRRFLKLAAGAAAAAAALAVGSLPRLARAADAPHVAESDPTAKALGYVEDAGNHQDAAAADYRKAIAAKPKQFEARLAQGLLLAHQGKYDEAREQIQQAT